MAAKSLNEAVCQNRRIIAVGTTTVRALESAATEEGLIQAGAGEDRSFYFPWIFFQNSSLYDYKFSFARLNFVDACVRACWN